MRWTLIGIAVRAVLVPLGYPVASAPLAAMVAVQLFLAMCALSFAFEKAPLGAHRAGPAPSAAGSANASSTPLLQSVDYSSGRRWVHAAWWAGGALVCGVVIGHTSPFTWESLVLAGLVGVVLSRGSYRAEVAKSGAG